MKKVVFMVISIFVLGTVIFGAPEVSQKTKILVLPFTDVADSGYKAGEKLSSNISSKLAEMGRFEVVDRMELGKIIEEQKLSQTGIVDSGQAVEIGKVAGAKLAFTGNIVSLNTYREEIIKEKSTNIGVIKITKEEKSYKKEWNAKIAVNVKLIDVETNITLKSFTQNAFFTTSDVNTREAAIDGAIAEVTDNIMYNVKDIFAIKSYIISKDRNIAVIRLGEDMGIKRGMEFYVYGQDRYIQDKVTNTDIKVSGNKKGLIIINKVDQNSANARVAKGTKEISQGDIIKEKPFMSANLDLSLGIMPFKMDAVGVNKKYIYTTGGVQNYFVLKLDQDEIEKAAYINLNLSPAYRIIKPSIDFNVGLNSPIMSLGMDLNIDAAKNIFDVLEVSAGVGIGGKWAGGELGTMQVNRNGTAGLMDVFFDTGSNFKDGASINLSGFSFELKAKAKAAFNVNENIALFGEGGYNLGKISSWTVETQDLDGETVELPVGDLGVGDLDFTGVYYGGGIRFIF